MALEVRNVEGIRSLDIRYELTVNAPIDKVFDALTERTGEWWTHTFDKDAKDVVFEPRLGGRFYEDWGGGQGALYATVARIRRPTLVTVTGAMGMARATNVITYELEPRGDTTVLRLTHWGYGDLDDDTERSYRAGWQALLDESLRELVERGTRKGPRGRAGR